jgi:ketosteroid isomerase-like protein
MSQPVRFDGGSPEDRRRLLALHEAYLEANGRFDVDALRKIWSADPTSIFFNLNGHTYVGLEQQWARLWDHYRTRLRTVEPWVSRDVKVTVRGDMALITCHRTCRLDWVGDGPPPTGFAGKTIGSRSTEVLAREGGDWKVVHVHFSVASEEPRPGDI